MRRRRSRARLALWDEVEGIQARYTQGRNHAARLVAWKSRDALLGSVVDYHPGEPRLSGGRDPAPPCRSRRRAGLDQQSGRRRPVRHPPPVLLGRRRLHAARRASGAALPFCTTGWTTRGRFPGPTPMPAATPSTRYCWRTLGFPAQRSRARRASSPPTAWRRSRPGRGRLRAALARAAQHVAAAGRLAGASSVPQLRGRHAGG